MPFALADKIPPFLRGRLGLGLFAIAGLLVSAAAAWKLGDSERAAIAQDFERRQNLRHDFLRQSFGEYENSLFALRLVVENNYELAPSEFERAASEIHARTPGIQAIQWVPLVPAAAASAFTGRVRDLLHPDFQIRRMGADGKLAPVPPAEFAAPDARESAVITYVYPLASNETSLGYDTFTAPTAPELNRARRTLAITLTRPLRLVQGYDGVVLTCLARREDTSDGPPVAGPGFVQLVLRMSPVLQRIWNLSPGGVADFALYDITTDPPVPLYAQLAGRPTFEATPPPLHEFTTPDTIVRDFAIGGRTLRACYRPRDGWLASRQSMSAYAVLGCGVALTLLGCAYLRLLQRHAESIRQEVAERTAELNESRALLDTLIRHSPSAIWIKDSALRFQLVNAEFCRIYTRESHELLGCTDLALHPADVVEKLESTDRDILRTGESLNSEATYLIHGESRTYIFSKFPLSNAAGQIHAVAGIATDITARRRAESERATMERRLLETQKLESLGVLAGGIAHDFNNLLTGILGHASLCRTQLEPGSPHLHSIDQIEHGARRAAELCQQMLAYSGRGRFAVEAVELGSLVRDTVPLLRLSISKHARLRFEFATGLPAVVADLTQLRQIIMNLVMNASDALGDREGDITLRTRLVAADAALFARCVHSPEIAPGDYVELEVADTGSGMSLETLARIFDPFFTTKFTGRGLGLAAVLGIVRGHRGALRVTSEPGVGTTFRLYLPATSGPSRSVTTPHFAVSVAAPANGPARRLLLVDDEAPVRDTAALLLQSLGYEVETAANGPEAIALFRKDPLRPHAALIDLTMPGLSGGELLRELRALRPDFPILLMSGYSESDAAALLATPRTAFLPKPFSLAILREKVAALLAA
ncbi:MAG: CHASE domain-containing protein [Burkholderiales bacterium]|nr:CHASE domain-containing protein [Opitutaceae bacterium]